MAFINSQRSSSPISFSLRHVEGPDSSPYLRLFFYGSLRQGLLNHHLLTSYFGDEIVFESKVSTTTPAYLISLKNKAYPYLTFTSPPASNSTIKGAHVIGETYLVPRCHPGLLKLDELEDEYSIVEIDVRTLDDSFSTLRAQAYVIDNRSMVKSEDVWSRVINSSDDLFLVESGDWTSIGKKSTGEGGDKEGVVVDE